MPIARLLVALLGFLVLSALPAKAQDGLAMRDIMSRLGLLPEEKDPIDYRERPSLVVPKDTTKLRPPESPDSAAVQRWPVDPDVKARVEAKARRDRAFRTTGLNDPENGGRLSLDEMAAGRSARGQRMGESNTLLNDREGIRLSVEEMTAADQKSRVAAYPPGTEPPRRHLTDPPTGTRIPSSQAAIGRRTYDNAEPVLRDDKPRDAWTPLE